MTVQIFITTEPPCCENYVRKSVARINFSEINLVIVEKILKLFCARELLKLAVARKEAIKLSIFNKQLWIRR